MPPSPEQMAVLELFLHSVVDVPCFSLTTVEVIKVLWHARPCTQEWHSLKTHWVSATQETGGFPAVPPMSPNADSQLLPAPLSVALCRQLWTQRFCQNIRVP